MNKQKSLNNKGFSLVELIIVIAIMAILIGVMAPNLLRYVERTNVSSDTQIADSLRMAVTTAIMDPAINPVDVAAFLTAARQAGPVVLTTGLQGDFLEAVNETLGYPAATSAADLMAGLVGDLRSANATPTFQVQVTAQNVVTVVITGTDASGSRDPATGPNIQVP